MEPPQDLGSTAPATVRCVAEDGGHLACPYCAAYGVSRLFLGSSKVDSCECTTCGARWDEDAATGAFLGRSSRQSALTRRRR